MSTDFKLSPEQMARVEKGHREMTRMNDSDPIKMALQVGTTKSVNGKTYVLNENHRWTNQHGDSHDHEEFRTMTGEQDRRNDQKLREHKAKTQTQTAKPGKQASSATRFYTPDVDADLSGDGVTDAARVGVPAFEVPPPPQKIYRLPNLQGTARMVEEDFASDFEKNYEEVTQKALTLFKAASGDGPVVFETDGAKELSPDWASKSLSDNLEKRSKNRATLNLALHQTANAITKRAFLTYLNTLPEGSEIMVTVGGCGAGKGFAQKKIPEAIELKSRCSAVWDSAGDQNATENPWVLEECEKRGLTASFLFVNADPRESWGHPEFGVIHRAQDPGNGRMVDAKVAADSYAIGAENHNSFAKKHANNPNAKFLFIQNTIGEKPKRIPGIPKESLGMDRRVLAADMVRIVTDWEKNNGSPLPDHVRNGALGGQSIWKD